MNKNIKHKSKCFVGYHIIYDDLFLYAKDEFDRLTIYNSGEYDYLEIYMVENNVWISLGEL